MSEQAIIKQKVDFLNRFRREGKARSQAYAERLKKEEYAQQLSENIHDAYAEWQSSLANFETAEGKDMVDYYAYRIKASEIRYAYLLRKAKQFKAQ